MKKIDPSIVIEVLGASLVATGVAMISIPSALIVLGTFLIWVTEKAN